ncbi:hypothetical protein VF21_10322 [Pseudogymnoascus sp. 05NY08]|nr:hypothetical protein VF21_10322 [Pseudogymnoascus sp. 05NY08]
MVEDGEAQRAAYVEEQRVIQEQAAQAECERQGLWVDSRIAVCSSMNIPALSSKVLVRRLARDQVKANSQQEGHEVWNLETQLDL